MCGGVRWCMVVCGGVQWCACSGVYSRGGSSGSSDVGVAVHAEGEWGGRGGTRGTLDDTSSSVTQVWEEVNLL